MRYYDSEYTTDYIKQFEGSSISTAFSESLYSSQAKSYINNIKIALDEQFLVTQEMDFISTGIKLWQNAMINAYSESGEEIPPFDYIRLSLIGTEQTITAGKIAIDSSNYVSRCIYLMEISNTGELYQLYPSKGDIEEYQPDPYLGSTPLECNFGKATSYYKFSGAMIGLFYGLFGVGILFSVLSIIFVAWNYNRRIITSFGKKHNFAYSFYILLLSLSSLPLVMYPESDTLCWNRIWMLGFSVKGVISLTLAKASNLWNHFKSKQSIKVAKSRVTVLRMLSWWLPLNIYEAVIIIIFRLVDHIQYIYYNII